MEFARGMSGSGALRMKFAGIRDDESTVGQSDYGTYHPSFQPLKCVCDIEEFFFSQQSQVA